jgi:hypothetical protein
MFIAEDRLHGRPRESIITRRRLLPGKAGFILWKWQPKNAF